MEETKLAVQIRNEIGTRKIKKVREEDCIPAVVYGGADKGPTPIKIDRRSYEKIMRAHHGQSVLFHLDVMEGEKKLRDYSAIVREEQYHPVKDDVVHIDFLRVSLKEAIEVEVAIEIVGEAEGVKKGGGSIDQPLREIEVICLPTQIPQHIEVDVSGLEIGDAVHVGELKLPEGVTTKHDPEAVVVSVVPPMKEEEDVEVAEGTQPEVIAKEKKESGEDKAAEAS